MQASDTNFMQLFWSGHVISTSKSAQIVTKRFHSQAMFSQTHGLNSTFEAYKKRRRKNCGKTERNLPD